MVDPTGALVNIQKMSQSEHFSAASTFRRVWQVSHALPEMDRMALFDAERSELVVLNALGREVWHGLDGVRTVRELAEALRGEAEGAPDQTQAEREVLLFLSDLHSRGAVELLDQEDGASAPSR